MRKRLIRVHSLIVPVFLLCSLGFGFAADPERKPEPLIPQTVSLPDSEDAQYFVQADSKGNLVLLRGDTLEVSPLEGNAPGEGKRLQLAIPTANQFSDVAGNGKSWALVESNRVHYFKDGRLQNTPEVGWLVTSVALEDDTPVAGVLPMSVGQARSAGRPKSPPLVVKLGRSGWETQVEGTFPSRATGGRDMFDVLFAEKTVRLASSRKGLWVSYPYAGRIVHHTPSGGTDLVITFGKGSPTYKGDPEKARQSVLSSLKEGGYENSRAKVGAFTAQLLIRGMAEGEGGDLYLLLDRAINGEASLARYNSVTNVLEAAPVHVSGEAELTMAAGRDGLVWTAMGASELWKLSWGTLEAAPWKEVEDVRLVSGGPDSDADGSR